MFAYPHICDLFRNRTITTLGGRKITIGSDIVANTLSKYMEFRLQEFRLTCRVGNLCAHQINKMEILMGTGMRLESTAFPNHVVQMSSHWRTHILTELKCGNGLVWADRFTEKGHQIVIKIKNQLKRMTPGS